MSYAPKCRKLPAHVVDLAEMHKTDYNLMPERTSKTLRRFKRLCSKQSNASCKSWCTWSEAQQDNFKLPKEQGGCSEILN